MKKTGIGILWSLPEMWEEGKNCHVENIVCPYCQSIETACVLYTQGEPWRSHICQRCGGHIMKDRWKVAGITKKCNAGSLPGLVASQEMASAAGIGEKCGGDCSQSKAENPDKQGTLF